MARCPPCSQNAHDETGGNGTRVVPCSRSAHDRNVLARRAQLDHYGCHSLRGEASKLGRITSRDVASFDARSGRSSRTLFREENTRQKNEVGSFLGSIRQRRTKKRPPPSRERRTPLLVCLMSRALPRAVASNPHRRETCTRPPRTASTHTSYGPQALAGCGKTFWVCLNFTGLRDCENRSTPRRMLKKVVQQGRSERRGEAYASVR